MKEDNFKTNENIKIDFSPPPFKIVFTDEEGNEVGFLDSSKGELEFGGDLSESAEIFFRSFLKHMCDNYIRSKISEWFERGKNSILRKNESGCCCKMDEDGETISELCLAHKVYFSNRFEEEINDRRK